jgi:hypothetical protein
LAPERLLLFGSFHLCAASLARGALLRLVVNLILRSERLPAQRITIVLVLPLV